MQHIREHFSVAHDRHTKYTYGHRMNRQFVVGDKVFLRVCPQKSPIHYGKGFKLAPQFVGPFEILEQIGPIAYRLVFLANFSYIHDVFHVSILRPYHPDIPHVLDWNSLQVEDDQLSLEPIHILQCQELTLRGRYIEKVRV